MSIILNPRIKYTGQMPSLIQVFCSETGPNFLKKYIREVLMFIFSGFGDIKNINIEVKIVVFKFLNLAYLVLMRQV